MINCLVVDDEPIARDGLLEHIRLPAVIFTTAYPEYAIEGYELDVLDYLLKPISFNRFLKSALKAQEFLSEKNKRGISSSSDFFFIKCNQKIERIKMNDVLYIEGMSNYIIVHTPQRKYISYLTSKSIEEQLPHNLFVRIHKSFLVAVNSIDTIDGNEVKIGKYTLPISKSHKDDVMNRIGNRLFKR